MADTIKKNDFIELDFTSSVKDGAVFDTTRKEDAKKANLQIDAKPLVLAVGHDMLLKGLDNAIEGKEVGKEYTIELKPEDAFGLRNKNLIKMFPLKVFHQQQIHPQAGMQLSLDGMIVRIASVSGGRVLTDFNNPLAGKTVIYNFKINKKVEDINEKVNALQEYFFRKKFEFTINDKELTFKVPEGFDKFVTMMEKPFIEILGMKVKAEIVKKEDKKEEKAGN
jgi:FKBP-type peptidyl-prolyl cis-trans isomerase SlyD